MNRHAQCLTRWQTNSFVRLMLLIVVGLLWSSSASSFKGGINIEQNLFTAIGEIGSCSATLISFDRVLTAAHCLCTFLQNRSADCHQTVVIRMTDSHRRAIELHGQIYYHPGYMKISPDLSHGIDLAVILLDDESKRLTTSAIAEGRLGYAPLEDPALSPVPGARFTLVSWGPTGSQCEVAWTGKNKLELSVTRVDPPYMKFVDPSRHACPGDSGSPALSANTRVMGIATGGNAASGLTTYTMTGPFFQWIMAPRSSDLRRRR